MVLGVVVYVYLYVCLCMYFCMHMCVHVSCVCVCACVYACRFMSLCLSLCSCRCISVHVVVCLCECVFVCKTLTWLSHVFIHHHVGKEAVSSFESYVYVIYALASLLCDMWAGVKLIKSHVHSNHILY